MQDSLDSLLEEALAGSGATSPQDAVVVALHSTLLAAGFECIAVGDEGFGDGRTPVGEPVSTCAKPQLPAGWNILQDVCSLQYIYVKTKQRCLVKVIPMGTQLLVSAVVQSCMDSVLSLTLLLSKYVKDTAVYKTPTIYKNLLDLMSVLKGDLEVKLIGICEKAGEPPLLTSGATLSSGPATSTPLTGHGGDPTVVPSPMRPGARGGDNDPLRIGPPIRPEVNDPLRIGQPRRPGGDPDPLAGLGPFGYGDRDRFPGGGGGGGMIFDPFRGGGHGGRGEMPGYGPTTGGPYPPGHPPGARFDPVGPLRPPFVPRPGPTRPNPRPPQRALYGPDPDHLPPPGYDDMFS